MQELIKLNICIVCNGLVNNKIMTTKQQLSTLLEYYSSSRRIGHTTAMLNGAFKVPCVVIAASNESCRHIKTFNDNLRVISLTALDSQLRGVHSPILLDNFTLMTLFNGAFQEITKLENEIKELNFKLQETNSKAKPVYFYKNLTREQVCTALTMEMLPNLSICSVHFQVVFELNKKHTDETLLNFASTLTNNE